MKGFRFAITGLLSRIFILLALSAATAVLVYQKHWIIAAWLFFFMIILFANTLYVVNGVNRKLAYFFESARNEELSLKFPEQVKPASMMSLHRNMNSIISLIYEFKIRYEQREKFLREMISRSPTGHIVIDESGKVEVINSTALGLIGLSYLAHLNLLKQKNRPFYDTLTRIKPGQVQMLKIVEENEIRYLSIKVSYLKYKEKHYRLYSIYDIRSELEENELDSWQKLIRVLTHEIMNSIAPITSMSNTLKELYMKNSTPVSQSDVDENTIIQTLQGLDVIEEQGTGLVDFVKAYRELTRIPKAVFNSMNVYEFLSRMEFLLKPRLNENGIELIMESRDRETELVADEKLLSRVLINLVDNAMEALASSKNKIIRIDTDSDINGHLVITVTDTGHGISQDNIDKIFIPFFTTRENGSGIGLSLSRQIMRLHKGSINVQSRTGRGTTFSLVF